MKLALGNWQLDLVSGGGFLLDGGLMFGVVPKRLWQDFVTPDDLNRIPVANHCVLARDGRSTVLIDTGYGGKYPPLDRKFYGMESGEPLITSLANIGVVPEDIDMVLLSHLHFDHVCGATRLDGGRLSATFPNATHCVGRCEWEQATKGAPELETAYPKRDILALNELTRVRLVDDGEYVVPGIVARVTGGHTLGHLSFLIQSSGQTALYPGDICPSTLHLRRMWHLSYDVFPLETRRRKPLMLADAADDQWWIIWNHDPRIPFSRVARDARCEFLPVDTPRQMAIDSVERMAIDSTMNQV